MKVEHTAEIDAAPKVLYDIVMDAQRLADWVSIHERLEDSPPGRLKKGSELTQRLKLAGRSFKVSWKVVEVDPEERVVWEGRGPMGSKARVVYDFQPSGDGTRFCYANSYDLPGGALGRMAGPMVKRVTQGELEESLRNLQSLAENAK